MWLFLSSGLLMPATFPADKVDPKYLTAEKGFDIQVRARIQSHLTNFIRDYMEPMGFEYSEIQVTPEMDYNARFYARKADFAAAMGQAILDIDFEKFKPTAERRDKDGKLLYADGKAYHSVLNSIWGTLTQLAPAGGKWSRDWAKAPRTYSGYDAWTKGDKIGSRSDLDIPPYTDNWRDFELDYPEWDDESEVQDIIRSMDNIPRSQWEDYLSPDEMILVKNHEQETAMAFQDAPRTHGRRSKSRKARNGRRFFQKK